MPDISVHQPIVVATDGTPEALRGVRFAALEARRLGVGLDVVHVMPSYLPSGTFPMVPDGSLEQYGHDVLERSVTAALDIAGDVETIPRLLRGRRVTSIVRATEHAPLLVLGSRPLTPAQRVWTGATVAGVVARSHCPVVVVPGDWEPEPGTKPRAVVGFKSPQHAAELFAYASALADRRGASLEVVHAWRLPTAYDDIIVDRVADEQWYESERAVIDSLLSDSRAAHPDLVVTVTVVQERPAHALVEASRGADRLVLMRPAHGGYLHHLGAVARAVLQQAHAPVEVIAPVPAGTGVSEPALEDHSTLER